MIVPSRALRSMSITASVIAGLACATAAFADCAEDAELTVTAKITNIVAVKSGTSDPYIGIETSGDGNACRVDTIWLDDRGAPEACKVGASVTAVGTLDFGGFGDEVNLSSVRSLACK